MQFDFEKFFANNPTGEGEMRLFGAPRHRIVKAAFSGKWNSARRCLMLEEMLEFDDGHIRDRIWCFSKSGPYWRGVCPRDVWGEVKGRTLQTVTTLRFTFLFPVCRFARIPVVCTAMLCPVTPENLDLRIKMALGGYTFGETRLALRTSPVLAAATPQSQAPAPLPAIGTVTGQPAFA